MRVIHGWILYIGFHSTNAESELESVDVCVILLLLWLRAFAPMFVFFLWSGGCNEHFLNFCCPLKCHDLLCVPPVEGASMQSHRLTMGHGLVFWSVHWLIGNWVMCWLHVDQWLSVCIGMKHLHSYLPSKSNIQKHKFLWCIISNTLVSSWSTVDRNLSFFV